MTETAERTWTSIQRARAEDALQRDRDQAALLANVLSDLETEVTVPAQLDRLLQNLVPTLADFATVEAPELDDSGALSPSQRPATCTPSKTKVGVRELP